MQEYYDYEMQKEYLRTALASIVKKRRLKCKKSISLISNEIGMTKSMWGDLERAIKDPQLSTLWRVAEALEIPLSTLIIELENTLGKDFSLID